MTLQERRLRDALRETLPNLHFRYQAPLGRYHPDFCSHRARLIIEVDGSQHADAVEYDAERTAFFESQGYRVLRFWNNEVTDNLEGVIRAIMADLPSPLVGEGGAKRRMGGARRRSARASSPAASPQESKEPRQSRAPTSTRPAPPPNPPHRGEGFKSSSLHP
jgi:very-short-patch-repair endonuclease